MKTPTTFAYCLAISASLAASQPGPQTPAAANAAFAFKLLRQLAKDQPRGNIFISPYGASTALQMASNGAGGKTKSEIQQVLGISSLQSNDLNQANTRVTRSLGAVGTNVVLAIANAIWYRIGTPVRPEFIAANQQSFQATVAPMDFNVPAIIAMSVMNVARGALAAQAAHEVGAVELFGYRITKATGDVIEHMDGFEDLFKKWGDRLNTAMRSNDAGNDCYRLVAQVLQDCSHASNKIMESKIGRSLPKRQPQSLVAKPAPSPRKPRRGR